LAIADIIRILVEHEVEFVIVGGMAAVLQGAPVNTFDLDVVYDRSPENVQRVLSALSKLDAIFRDDPRRLRPNESHLASAGHKLIETNRGPLDLLGTIEENTGFADLVADSEWLDVGDLRVRVLTLARLIRVKEQLGRAKDKAMLIILRATLDEKQRG
jgi:predicted nucleotidyltransferase